MSDPGKAVFLSYASQDAEAARRIAEALRAAGVEVWFDQNELVGGDAWDQKIRRQIKECALFVPIISPNTNTRAEGYFRREWKQAVERTHDMADDVPFLFPIVIGDVSDATARVPDKFREVQWTRLRLDETPAELATRVARLLSGERTEDRGRKTGDRPTRRKEKTGLEKWWWLIFPIMGMAVPIIGVLKSRAPSVRSSPAPVLNEADQLVRQARELIYDPDSARNEFSLAESLLKRATDLAPSSGAAWGASALLNHYFFSRGYDRDRPRLVRSQAEADKALRLDPRNTDGLLALGLHRLELGEKGRARDYLDRAVAADPQNFKAILAQSLQLEEHYARARFLLDAAGRVSRPAELYYYASLELEWSWRLEEARAACDRAIAAQPFWRTFVQRASLEENMTADPAKIEAWLDRVPDAKRDEPRVAYLRFQAAMLRRDGVAAVRALTSVAADYMEDNVYTGPKAFLLARARELAGQSGQAAEQWQMAERILRERLAAEPGSIVNRTMLAVCLAGSGRPAEARILAEACTGDERLQESANAIEMLADAWIRLGEPDRAITLLRSVPKAQTPAGGISAATIAASPRWDSLRERPGYAQLLAELKRAEKGGGGPSPLMATDDKSVAVLAFANLSDDKANEYFSDGISEELLNVLAKVPGLTVRGRSSGFYFKGKLAKSAEIGQQLNVAYLVQGSVRRAGDRVRISAQLIRAATDEVVWSSGSLDREVKDIFAVQDEIAGLIAKNLSVSIGVAARAPHQVNPEALTALLEGRQFWLLRTMEGFARAGVLFRRALELDPDWAPARAALANLLTIEASYRRGGGEEVSERFALAAQEAKRAIELDPNLGEPHAALGKIEMENLRHAEADKEFRRALALEPNNALVRDWYGDLLVTQGRLDLAIDEYRRAAEIEPLSPYILWDLAWELMHVRRYSESLALVERAIALTPNGAPRLTIRRARLLLELGRRAEAEAALRPFLDGFRADSDPQIANEMIWCLQRLGLTPDRERWSTELLRQSPGSFSSGVILLMRGEEDRAYPLLEKCPPIFWQQIYWDPVFDPVRETPRFQQMLEKLGCAAEYQVARATLTRLLKEAGVAN